MRFPSVRFIRLLLSGAAALASAGALAENYRIDEAHSSVHFKASHLGYAYVVGRFNDFEGAFSYDADNPGAATVRVTIDAASLDSNHAERDRHLRSGDFLEVKAHPTITFSGTGFEEAADGAVVITGDLDFHGVQKSERLNGRHVGHGDDPWGGYRRGFEATVMLDASAFGLSKRVGEVEVTLIVEGVRVD